MFYVFECLFILFCLLFTSIRRIFVWRMSIFLWFSSLIMLVTLIESSRAQICMYMHTNTVCSEISLWHSPILNVPFVDMRPNPQETVCCTYVPSLYLSVSLSICLSPRCLRTWQCRMRQWESFSQEKLHRKSPFALCIVSEKQLRYMIFDILSYRPVM